MTIFPTRGFLYQVLFVSILAFLVSCGSEKNKKELNKIVKVQSKDALKSLNPLTISDAFSNYICMQIYQPLLAIDFESNELVGVLAESRPSIQVNDSLIKIKYKLREGVRFNSTLPLLAKDVSFSLKLNVCSFINPFYASYYEFIDSLSFQDDSSREFIIYGHGKYHLNEYASGDYFILSQEKMDPNGILDKYSISDLKNLDIEKSPKPLVDFLNNFKNSNFLEEEKVFGSGAYQYLRSNNELVLKLQKKDNWWGDQFNSNSLLIAYPKKMEYDIVKDDITALNALKAGEFDVFPNLLPKDFIKLKSDASFLSSFQIDTVNRNAYFYLGYNLQNPKLKDINLRKAIAFATDIEDIIENLEYGLASRINAPFKSPYQKGKDLLLNSYDFNSDSVQYYLNRHRVLSGNNSEPILLTYSYNSGNKTRESIGLILKQSLKDYNVDIDLKAYEWSVYLQKLKNGEVELFINGSSTSSLPPDFASSFHSHSAAMGRNYANYKSPIADSLIEIINSDLEEDSRNKNIAVFQKLINEDLPYYFLYQPKRIMVFSKNLSNARAYNQRPNYWVPALKWKE